MGSIISADPFRCRVWSLHERLEEFIDERSCKAEIQSFLDRGQLIPAIGRRILGDAAFDYEVVCGARRLFVARHVKQPLQLDVRELTDQQALVASDIENRQRQDVSPYERGMSYSRALRSGCFKSQDELAAALGVSASQVSRLLKLARLPCVVVNAFANPAELCEGWGKELAALIADDFSKPLLLRTARRLAELTPRKPSAEVYRALLASASEGRAPRAQAQDIVVKDEAGSPLFRIRYQRDAIALLLPSTKISGRKLERVRESVAAILREGESMPGRERVRPSSNLVHHNA